MGAFFLYHKSANINKEKIFHSFKNRGFSKSSVFVLGSYNLILFNKIFSNNINYFKEGNNYIFSTGTLLYKNASYPQNLKFFIRDFIRNKVDNQNILGCYCIILWIKNKLYLLTDYEALYQVYISKDCRLISSSFLTLSENYSESLTLDRMAILSNLLTGCSYGEDTFFNEIKKLSRINYKHFTFDDFEILSYDKQQLLNKPLNKYEAFNNLQQLFEKYFKGISNMVENQKVNIGLSAGYDSRLLLALAIKYLGKKSINVYSNYKNPPDHDFKYAKIIAESEDLTLFSYPVTDTISMNEGTLYNTMFEAMNYYDGQFRTNHGWTRQYRTFKYRQEVLGNAILEISGHAGELFRNDFQIANNLISKKNWVVYSILEKQNIKKTNKKRELVGYLLDHLNLLLPIAKGRLEINQIQKLYNEGWVNSGPGIRISIDNQLSFFLSPFTDYEISHYAYFLTPFLGSYAEFEKEFLRVINNNLFNIPFKRNKYLLDNRIYTIAKFICGLDLNYYYRKYYQRRNVNLKQRFNQLNKQYEFIRNQNLLLSNFNITDLDKYSQNILDESELDRLLALGFLLNYFKNKISG